MWRNGEKFGEKFGEKKLIIDFLSSVEKEQSGRSLLLLGALLATASN